MATGDIIVLLLFIVFVVFIALILAATAYLVLQPLLAKRLKPLSAAHKGLFLLGLLYPVFMVAFSLYFFDGPDNPSVFPFLITNLAVFVLLTSLAWLYRKRYTVNYAASATNLLGASFNSLLLLAAVLG